MSVPVFLKIPKPTQKVSGFTDDDYEMVQVDPSRLHLGILHELYVRNGISRGVQKYAIFRNDESASVQLFDLSKLVSIVGDITEQYGLTLDGLTEEVAKTSTERFVRESSRLTELLSLLTQGRHSKAEEVLSDVLHGIFSEVCVLSSQLEHLTGVALQNERLKATFEKESGIFEHIYMSWSTAAAELIDSVKKLKDIQLQVQNFSNSHAERYEKWTVLVDEHGPGLSDLLKKLGEFETQFVLDGDKLSPALIGQKTTEADELIADCRKREVEAKERYKNSFDIYQQTIVPLREQARGLETTLDRSAKTMRSLGVHFAQAALPFEIPNAMISKSEYLRAQEILVSSEWSLTRVRQEMVILFDAAEQIFREEPRMPDSVVSTLDRVERRITEILEKETEPPAPSTLENSGSETKLGVSEEDEEKDIPFQERASELYELALCVGYVLTCRKVPPLTCTNHRSILEVLFYAGCCTEEEMTKYKVTLGAMIEALSVWVDRESTSVGDTWEDSSSIWISFKPNYPARKGYKLTKKAGEEVQAKKLFEKYKLTPDLIRKAHQQKKGCFL